MDNKFTIKDLREILVHFQEPEYDDYEFVLWDFNNQREARIAGGYSFSKPDKKLCIPIELEPVDGVSITERLKSIVEQYSNKNLQE